MSSPTGNYTREEERHIVDAIRGGGRPVCPRCGLRLAERDVRPRDDVSYVRRRLLLVCGKCRRSAAVDRRGSQ